MKIKVYKVRPTAKLPVRGHPTDAGMDVFWCPELEATETGESSWSPGWIILKEGQSHIFETGLKIEVPENYMLQVMNKSGIASKKNLSVGACVVDSGYNGEIFVNLHNIGKKDQYIEQGQKLAQLVLCPVVIPEIVNIKEDRVYDFETARGTGSLGSTGDS